MKPEITIGICVKNSQSSVGEAVKSVVTQHYRHDLMEVIVIDGNSKDATLSIVTHLLSQSRIRWRSYSDEGKGLGYARQIVVKQARGRYIIFADADAVIGDGFLSRQVDFMRLHRRVAIGLGRQMYREGKGGSWLSNAWDICRSNALDPGGGFKSVCICRTNALRSVGGFDERIKGAGEDLDIIERLRSNGWSRAINKEAEYFHLSQESLRGFWSHHKWFGYGEYYLAHKHRDLIRPWRSLPLGQLLYGLRLAPMTYRSTRRKASFLVLPLLIFGSMAWWVGFARASIDRYGRPD